ncbi:ATPase [Chitinophaga parva]|uniref:ATPase n=1 Tax=Chitinophaga parva TaxID=2169414 RepID=A0A2T7BHT9_9BACT|nr:SRPBCC domain-containing protein [Chitinophaga parva]PUZ25813.1 ATPase [Chitinophaga parva]
MEKQIRHSIFFPQQPEQVWEFITDAELIAQWLMPNDFKPLPGHEFTFRISPMPQFDFDGIVYCKVLEIAAPHKLSYSWKGGPGDGSTNLDSVVTITLSPKEKGTEMTLVHDRFKVLENLRIFDAMDKGWLQNMHKMAAGLQARHQTVS